MSYEVNNIWRGPIVRSKVGIEIKHKGKFHSIERFDDGLVGCIYKEGSDEYFGRLYTSALNPAMYRDLTDRLAELTGKEVPNEDTDFLEIISRGSLNQQYPNDLSIKVNNKYQFYGREVSKEFSRYAHYLGSLTTVLGIGGLTALVATSPEARGYDTALALVGFSLAEILVGFFSGKLCGPAHAIGFAPIYFLRRAKVMNPSYAPNRFLEAFDTFEDRKKEVDARKFAKLLKNVDRYYGVIDSYMRNINSYKGISVSYRHRDKQSVKDLLQFLANGKNKPGQIGQPEEEPETEQLEKVKLTDPWEVDIPEIGEVGR